MPKKTEDVAVEEMVDDLSAGYVDTLEVEFQRDDLNALRDKLNEVVRAVNNLL